MAADAPEPSDETSPGEVPIVVSDTGVFLRTTINDTNVCSSFLRRAAAREVRLCVSNALLEEIRDVLTRPEIRIKNTRLTGEALEAFIRETEKRNTTPLAISIITPILLANPSHHSQTGGPDSAWLVSHRCRYQTDIPLPIQRGCDPVEHLECVTVVVGVLGS